MENVRILLVDDEQDIVDTVKYSLELRGFAVDVAYDGPSALVKARKGRYDVMILDVMLPGKNGYEVSRLLKEDAEKGMIDGLRDHPFHGETAHERVEGGFCLHLVEGGRVHLQAFRDGGSAR